VKAGSNLENVLRSGAFAVTGELGPPKSGDLELVRKKARILKGHVDAVNITDCQTAIVRMSSLTAGLAALSEGVEPVMQMTCRDRNRIGMQADILGAAALGVKNLLCLTGDHQKFGNHPQSKGVFDMDSIQLLQMVRGMRDEKRFQCGEEIKGHEPRLFLGCAANPFADPFEFRPVRLAKKVAAGADFVQTQIIYNVEKFAKFMEMVRDLGVHERCYILAGVTPPKSLGMARYMKKFVPGLDVTDEVLERLSDAKDQREEGINICVDIINRVREIPGVAGVHVMAIEWEEAVPEIVKRAGLSDRPEPKGIEPVLSSSASIEKAVEDARKEVRIEFEEELERARTEAQASRELVIKEKEKVASEISDLKKQIEEARTMASRKEAEVQKLTEEIQKAKRELETRKPEGPPAPGPAAPAPPPPGPAGPLTDREQRVLESLNMGLQALKSVLGLDDAQFEALRRFLEAEFMLQFGQAVAPAAPAPVPPPARPEEPRPRPEAPPAPAEAPAATAPAAEEAPEEERPARNKEVVNLVAKGNLALHSGDYNGAIDAFEKALEIDSSDEKAKAGLSEARAALEKALSAVKEATSEAAPPETAEGLPPRPEEVDEGWWKEKWVVRYTARGNVALMKGDYDQAVAEFEKALALDPSNEKARAGLERAKNREGIFIPDVKAGAAPAEEKKAEAPAEPEVKEAEEKEAVPEKPAEKAEAKPEAKPEEKAEKPAAPKIEISAPAGEGVTELSVSALSKDEPPLSERAGDIPEDVYKEVCSGAIQGVTIGDGEKALTVGGETALPFYNFEGDMPNPPRVAFEVLDSEPEEWPEVLTKYFSDCLGDPAAWARKCVREYNAKSICLSLISTDPNGADVAPADAAEVAQKVVEAVDVPVIFWGCGNADKDTETLREITGRIGERKVCLGPLTDANYRSLGATAMAFQYPVVASTPIDVNLAKQLNILLENLGVHLDHILMDPSIGAVGYGLEYTYSVMERIRLAALTQQDDKLSCPFIVNLGREVWKAKETRLPTDGMLGDQERRGVLMEAITASSLLLAGGELMIMRHPKSAALTEALVEGLL
jgi:CO dehydrogenase/acetyl-CoA synthase delta subunit